MKLVRRPYNGRGITKRAIRHPFRGRCPDGLFVTETVTATQVSLLYRSPSFVLLASIAGEAIDIKDRAGCANKRPYFSLGIKKRVKSPMCAAMSLRRRPSKATVDAYGLPEASQAPLSVPRN